MRYVQLTALACAAVFATLAVDDGASAEMAHSVALADGADADVDGEDDDAGGSPWRAAAQDLREALPAAPTELDTDPDGAFATDEDIAEARRFLPHQCVHGVSEQRPKLTRNEQKRTAAVIAHVVKRLRASDDFGKLLQLVAARESSMQQGLVHRLSPDLEGSLQAWRKTAKFYEGNPHASDPELWQTYGLFGMNSNYFTRVWDDQADPRVLCDAIVDILVYRRAVARVVKKAGAPIRCQDEQGRTYDHVMRATWESVHRAVSGGKMCPTPNPDIASIMGKYFRTRATRVGLDPDRPVTLKMLGSEPSRGLDGAAWDDQEAVVMGLWAELEAAWEVDPPEAERAPTRLARKGA